MWKYVETLVKLRSNIDQLILDHVEHGTETDYITYEHIEKLAKLADLHKGHHMDQVVAAIDESPVWKDLGAIALVEHIRCNECDQQEDKEISCNVCCFVTNIGYHKLRTKMNVGLRNGSICKMNHFMCTCDFRCYEQVPHAFYFLS